MDNRRSETSSRLMTTSDQAVHNFEVTDFSLLEGMSSGRHVSSMTFTAGGRAWNIRLFPDGCNEGAHASVYLCFVGGAKDARTKYTLELLQEKDGEVSDVQLQATTIMISRTFGEPGATWGFPRFVDKSKLKLLARLNGDSFTIRCVLTVVGESESENVAVMAVPPSDIHQHFEHMLKDGRGADVAFDVDGRLFRAHRCVLAARSPVFAAELFGPMKEKDTAEPIKVDDMEPCVFEELLRFVYTDRISDDDKRGRGAGKNAAAQHLLVAADRYGLDRLRLMCEAKLCRGIGARTVATTLALAEQHRCARLKDACLEYVASRDMLGAVMETDGFKHLAASCPLVLVEILDKIASKARVSGVS